MKETFRIITFKTFKLAFGLFVFGIGSVCLLNAQIGVASWDVLHQGISIVTGMTVGKANIFVGFVVLIIDILLKQDIGWGTIANMILIGVYVDILIFYNLVPIFETFLPSLILLLIGIILQGIGFYIYISVGWGAGPRDGLMVALMKRTGSSVRFMKSIIETLVVAIGYLLGGNLGIGTLIVAFFSGAIWQFIFKLLKFDLTEVKHIYIREQLKLMSKTLSKEEETPNDKD